MCRSLHTNFFHKCGHEQFIEIPSVNPACQRQMASCWYKLYEWCPRCTWRGTLLPFVYPREYQEPGPAVQCQENGQTGRVIRTVRMPWNDKYNYTPQALWAERGRYWWEAYEFKQMRRERAYVALSRSPEQRALPPIQRRYFLREPSPGTAINSPEFYTFVSDVSDLRESGDVVCPICTFRIDLGINHEHACVGSDYTDTAGERIVGWPVRLPCNHVFGLGCIRQYFEENPGRNACPMCRTQFDFERDEPYRAPEGWHASKNWELMPTAEKFSYVRKEAYRRTIVWIQNTLAHIARIRTFHNVVWDDWEAWNNGSQTFVLTFLDYTAFLILNSLCLSHPFWMSWTNILLATIGWLVFWWTRPRPLDGANRNQFQFRLYFWFSFLGNFLEWMIDNQMRGWFRPVNYLWVFIYLNYFGYLIRNML